MSNRFEVPEPCLCGDPFCGRCFSQTPEEPDPDWSHDEMVADELRDKLLDIGSLSLFKRQAE